VKILFGVFLYDVADSMEENIFLPTLLQVVDELLRTDFHSLDFAEQSIKLLLGQHFGVGQIFDEVIVENIERVQVRRLRSDHFEFCFLDLLLMSTQSTYAGKLVQIGKNNETTRTQD
jgi:hypothetical protein